jgi:hypothetical protein
MNSPNHTNHQSPQILQISTFAFLLFAHTTNYPQGSAYTIPIVVTAAVTGAVALIGKYIHDAIALSKLKIEHDAQREAIERKEEIVAQLATCITHLHDKYQDYFLILSTINPDYILQITQLINQSGPYDYYLNALKRSVHELEQIYYLAYVIKAELDPGATELASLLESLMPQAEESLGNLKKLTALVEQERGFICLHREMLWNHKQRYAPEKQLHELHKHEKVPSAEYNQALIQVIKIRMSSPNHSYPSLAYMTKLNDDIATLKKALEYLRSQKTYILYKGHQELAQTVSALLEVLHKTHDIIATSTYFVHERIAHEQALYIQKLADAAAKKLMKTQHLFVPRTLKFFALMVLAVCHSNSHPRSFDCVDKTAVVSGAISVVSGTLSFIILDYLGCLDHFDHFLDYLATKLGPPATLNYQFKTINVRTNTTITTTINFDNHTDKKVFDQLLKEMQANTGIMSKVLAITNRQEFHQKLELLVKVSEHICKHPLTRCSTSSAQGAFCLLSTYIGVYGSTYDSIKLINKVSETLDNLSNKFPLRTYNPNLHTKQVAFRESVDY